MDNIITLILICAAASLAVNVILKKFEVESVIGYILTGMAVGFAFDLQHSHSLEVIAEFGIVFLMFTIGLEFSPAKLRLMKKEVFVFGPLQLVGTALPFFMIGHWLLGLSVQVNLIVSLALALSSTAIVLNLLTKSRKISGRYGRNAVGVLLFQDIAVIPLLLMVSIFASTQESVPALLLEVLIDGVVVFLLLFLGGRILTPHVMEQVIGTRSNELFVGGILVFVVGAAQLAHGLGFSYSLGAFLAGMVIAETQYKHQVEADLTPFRDLLLGVFFITVGMQVNPVFVISNLPVILAVMAGLLLIKALILFAIMRLFNGTRTSVKTALLLSQCGEFSFVIFETAQVNGLFMDPKLGQVLIMAIVLTMMLTPFLFRYLDRITSALVKGPSRRQPRHEEEEDETLDAGDAERVVVFGFGRLGQRVAAHLDAADLPYLGVEHDGAAFRECRERGLPVVYGNAGQQQFLQQLHVEQARAVVIAMSNEPRILQVAQALRSVAPRVPVVVCVSSPALREELAELGVEVPIDSLEQTSVALADAVVALEALQAPAPVRG
ncbi:cation:proton antiporter [Motiliproteus sp. SC1-56]|uniref:cation:proton antiporter n=1 Tax=Motiliproteus sp. SC1-56 TaxID=2799565 RepID=UPI001A8E68CF|nr:cation:proton antiporter [Motiliproteus sp. SC1-56]